MTTKIKTCGMSRECDIEAVNAAKPDFCGFIVNFPKSHRSVSMERAEELASMLDPSIQPVAVFVDEALENVAAMVNRGVITIAQLHGSEDEDYIDQLRNEALDATIIKAFQVKTTEDVDEACKSTADLILLDSGQGSGAAFDWSVTASAHRPFLLAGGLSAQNLTQALESVRPWGVDLSSGLETNKLKDADKIKEAVQLTRRCNG